MHAGLETIPILHWNLATTTTQKIHTTKARKRKDRKKERKIGC